MFFIVFRGVCRNILMVEFYFIVIGLEFLGLDFGVFVFLISFLGDCIVFGLVRDYVLVFGGF